MLNPKQAGEAFYQAAVARRCGTRGLRSRAQGTRIPRIPVYDGLNLEGTLVRTAHDWTEAYYQRNSVLPPDILIRGNVHHRRADALVAAVRQRCQARAASDSEVAM